MDELFEDYFIRMREEHVKSFKDEDEEYRNNNHEIVMLGEKREVVLNRLSSGDSEIIEQYEALVLRQETLISKHMYDQGMKDAVKLLKHIDVMEGGKLL